MKKLLRRLAVWLYLRVGGSSVVLVRHALSGVQPNLESIELSLDRSTRSKFIHDCVQLSKFDSLDRVVDGLRAEQRQILATSRGMTKDDTDFAQGTLNGIKLVKETIEFYAMQHKEDKTEDFNKFDII